MKVAALDLGTNTFLLLLAEGRPGEITAVQKDVVEVVRLGQGVDKYKVFHPYALSRARACFERFQKLIEEYQPEKILAVATSAAREVENGQELFKLGEEFGIPIQVIEGKKEAEISFTGALAGLGVSNKDVAVIDIGGGSTEVIVGRSEQIHLSESLDVGGVRLTERFINQQPVLSEEKSQLLQFLDKKLNEFPNVEVLQKASRLIAVAGTPTTLAALEIGEFAPAKIDGFIFNLSMLEKWQNIFATTSVQEKKDKYNLGGRADIIFAGTTILLEFMKKFSFKEVMISTKGVRYGVALHLLSGHELTGRR